MRPDSRLLPLLALVSSLTLPSVAAAAPRRVAVVIGVSSYQALDPSTALPGAAQQAMDLSRTLEQDAGYDQVLPLVDAVATRASIEGLLFQTLAAQLQPDDLLLIYFVGHGLGEDFGEPYLLPSDVDPDDVQGTALSIPDLAHRLRDALPGTRLALLTDAVHDQRLGDLVLMGPNARSWPDLTGDFLSLSATGPRELPSQTPFARLVNDGLAGAADASGDGAVTSGELVRFVQAETAAMAGAEARPVEGGTVGPDLVLAQVHRGPQDFPAYVHEAHSPRARRIGGAVVAGLGLGLGAAGWGFYKDAVSIHPYVLSEASERLPPPDGKSYQSLRDRYTRDMWLEPVAFAAGGVLLATGGVLMVWPTPHGVAVGLQARF